MINLIGELLRRVQGEIFGRRPDRLSDDYWIDVSDDPADYYIETPEQEDDMTAEQDRPNPLRDAATKVGGIWSALGGIVGALAIFGVLTNAQADAVRAAGESASPVLLAVGSLIGGVLPIVTGLLAAFRTAKSAKPNVTPVADPRTLIAGKLVALVPAVAGRHTRDEDDE